MSAGAEPVGTIDVALKHTARLLERDPQLAAEQATEILRVAPGHPVAGVLLGTARRMSGRVEEALEILGRLAHAHPNLAVVQYEYGIALGAAGSGEEAVAALRRATQLNPELPGSWRALADHLAAMGDSQGADAAYARHIKTSTRDPRLLRPAAALCDNDIPLAESLLRAHLRENPTDVAAIRMLAEVAARLGRYIDAENLLARCLELAPSFTAARVQYATLLNRENRASEALRQIEPLLAAEPRNPHYRNLKATFLVGIGEYQQSIELYTGILTEYPHQAKIWLMLGHVQKTAAHQDEAVRAYRRAIELAPELGEAYWSLANLKTFRFTAEDVAAMHAQLARQTPIENQLHLHFALGKAYEDAARYSDSFHHYAEGNRLRKSQIRYSAQDNTAFLHRSQALYTREFFEARAGMGCQAPDPIFIVGLPRAGSTLVEQILSSHSLVEGTMELHDIIWLSQSLEARSQHDGRPGHYLDVLGTLAADRLRALGEQYLERTRIQRKTGAPFFIDKLPNNFRHVGLIHLILPNAKIIDARRHAMGSCFSAFKQHFARGQTFTYDLEDLGYYYRDYVELMAHFDAVLPGRVHRVQYEAMVEDTATEVRKLLDYCGLPFEAQCLRFYENRRAVRTASSEQVRRPIFREGLDQWRHYEPWLEPLRTALGRTID